MNNEAKFLEKLSGIKNLAEAQDRRITTREVEQYFSEDSLTQEQIEMVYDYLMTQRITVVGYTKVGKADEKNAGKTDTAQKAALTSDEEAYLRNYQKDLAAVKQESSGERDSLFRLALAGDALEIGRAHV